MRKHTLLPQITQIYTDCIHRLKLKFMLLVFEKKIQCRFCGLWEFDLRGKSTIGDLR